MEIADQPSGQQIPMETLLALIHIFIKTRTIRIKAIFRILFRMNFLVSKIRSNDLTFLKLESFLV